MPCAERAATPTRADITYGTNSEFGFDYLRDNMATSARGLRPARPRLRDRGRGRLDPHRRGAHAADHLGRARGRRATRTTTFARIVPEGAARSRRGLRGRREAQDRRRRTESGVDKVEQALGIENLYDPRQRQLVNHLIQALKAESLYKQRRRVRRPATARSRSSTSSPAASWRAAAGPRACTRRSRPRRA